MYYVQSTEYLTQRPIHNRAERTGSQNAYPLLRLGVYGACYA